MDLPFKIAPNAEVISAIGVALAMVRDTIERSVVNPTESDILSIRKEAEESVTKMGAAPDTVEVQIEVDPQKNVLRAIATGSTEMRKQDLGGKELGDEELDKAVQQSVRGTITSIQKVVEVSNLVVYKVTTTSKRLLGLISQQREQIRVIDRNGVIRLQIAKGDALATTKSNIGSVLRRFVEQYTMYGDAGREVPGVYIVFRGRILDLSGLIEPDQIVALASMELEKISPDEPISILVRQP
jgi:hypothetical protein